MWIKILVSLCLWPIMAQAQESTDTSTTVKAAKVQQEAEQETQETPAEASGERVEKMEVTGSYIRRTDVEGPSPVLVIDREMIERSGFNSVSQVLNRSTVSPFGGGGSTVSLKGIGSARTLVLINGQRAPGSGSSYASGAVSVNLVPIAAVDRIEVLKDGASATYGSDALGGVINIITRKDIDGYAFANQYNMSTNNGSDFNRTALAYGTQSAKSNFMTSVQVTYSQGVRSSDFEWARELNQSFPFSTNYFTDGFAGIAPGPDCTLLDDTGACAEEVAPRQVTLPGFSVDNVTQYSRSLSGDTTLYASLVAGYGRSQNQFPNLLNTPGETLGLGFGGTNSVTGQPQPAPNAAWTALPGYSGGATRIYHRFDDYVNTSTDQNYYGGLVVGTKGYIGDSDWQWDTSLNNQVNILETSEENLATVTRSPAPTRPSVRELTTLLTPTNGTPAVLGSTLSTATPPSCIGWKEK